MRSPHIILTVCGLTACTGLSAQTPVKFEFADFHLSPKSTSSASPFMRATPVRNGRYEIRNATLVDLIRTAWGFDADKILGGPAWLEMNRFDLNARVPDGTTPDALKPMLQVLLEERLALKVHPDSKPLPTYVLVAGKKPQLKEADGSGDSGCKPGNVPGQTAPEGSGIRLVLNGAPLALGPGMQLQYSCRNMTMDAFAAGLRNMLGAQVGPNPVRDETGLKGMWNFDVRWSLQMLGGPADGGERISIFDAVEKQLGLKLEQRPFVTPVLIVDSANEMPSANPPGTDQVLPPNVIPAAFDVADIKPSDPNSTGGRFQMQAGRRLAIQGMPMQFILVRAFETVTNEQFVGLPK